MLVLTRRGKDRVSFPQVGITIHFLRIQAGQAKVGIDAPRDIAIIREEVDNDQTAEFVRRQLAQLPREVRHGIRNELHEISVGMHLVRELVRQDLLDEAEETFQSIQDALQRLDQNHALRRPEQDEHEIRHEASKQLVLIEDDRNQRKMLGDILRLQGYSVADFDEGDAALQFLEDNEPPWAILVDMHMPGRDGRGTVREIRGSDRFKSVPIFAVSGTSPEENGLPMGRTGVDRWFPKPLSVEHLMSAIQQPDLSASGNHAPV